MNKSSPNNTVASIRALNVSFSNGKKNVQVLYDIGFDIYKNEILAVVGESGSGKSVTSKALMGLLPSQTAQVTAQELTLQGKDLLPLKDGEWSRFRGSEISMIFQEPMSSLNPTITCGNQVAEVLQQHQNSSSAPSKKEVLRLFEKVKLPTPEITFSKYPHEISGGQMQRVMIAMAIACKPALLIADEPTTALDVTVQKEIILLLKELQKEYGMSILFISHDLSLVQSIADRIIVMYQGRIVEQGTAKAIFDHPKETYTRALIASRPSTKKRLQKLPTINDFIENSVSDEVITKEQREESHQRIYQTLPLLQVIDVVKDYPLKKRLFSKQKYFRAVNGVSFNLYPGESLGLVGESGCGKSTLGDLILRLKEVTSGSIIYREQDITHLSGLPMRKLRKEIQIIFQDPFASLNPRLTVGQSIIEPMKWHGIGKNNSDRKEKVLNLLKRVGLTEEHYNRYPHEFSGGQRQRIGIARTVALEPKLIICDESVSALDISVQAQVLNLLNEFKKDFGFSYLFISHDLAVVKYFCDQVIVMNEGKIEEKNEADALYANPQSAYTKKLIAAIPK
ncbi:MAG: peptide/nickel transport system ATP-binding protein [Planctomycetota bacterium]|jgi:peptide/nickel transport system ATP-binding protein|uniref:ABC transporter ATP-binding protein n=1 Tax=Nonlabens sp. TaxID=1888209 RepID=UPI0035A5F20A